MASSDGMLSAIIIVLSLNFMIFIVGFALEDLGGVDANPFNYEDNTLREFNTKNSTTYGIPVNVSGRLPGGEGKTVSPDTGLSFTDMFTSIKSWFIDSTGLGYVLSILSGPKVILSVMGMPLAAAWALTALWYGITLFMLVSFIWGR